MVWIDKNDSLIRDKGGNEKESLKAKEKTFIHRHCKKEVIWKKKEKKQQQRRKNHLSVSRRTKAREWIPSFQVTTLKKAHSADSKLHTALITAYVWGDLGKHNWHFTHTYEIHQFKLKIRFCAMAFCSHRISALCTDLKGHVITCQKNKDATSIQWTYTLIINHLYCFFFSIIIMYYSIWTFSVCVSLF